MVDVESTSEEESKSNGAALVSMTMSNLLDAWGVKECTVVLTDPEFPPVGMHMLNPLVL